MTHTAVLTFPCACMAMKRNSRQTQYFCVGSTLNYICLFFIGFIHFWASYFFKILSFKLIYKVCENCVKIRYLEIMLCVSPCLFNFWRRARVQIFYLILVSALSNVERKKKVHNNELTKGSIFSVIALQDWCHITFWGSYNERSIVITWKMTQKNLYLYIKGRIRSH